APRVEEFLNALAGQELAAGALALDRALVPGVQGFVTPRLKRVELRLRSLVGLRRHGSIFLQTRGISPHLAGHACRFRGYARTRVVARGGPKTSSRTSEYMTMSRRSPLSASDERRTPSRTKPAFS